LKTRLLGAKNWQLPIQVTRLRQSTGQNGDEEQGWALLPDALSDLGYMRPGGQHRNATPGRRYELLEHLYEHLFRCVVGRTPQDQGWC
jgi:hypothetical protein